MPSRHLAATRDGEVSPRTRDLANRLKQEIDNFASQNPGTRPEDIRAAGMLVTSGGSERPPEARRAVAGVLAGLLVAGVLAAWLIGRGTGGGTGQSFPMIAVAIGVALLGALFGRVLRRRD